MIRIQKYFEQRDNGHRTGRVLYSVNGNLPAAAAECLWEIDPFFKIEDDITHDPEKLNYYRKALTDGFVIIPD